MRHEYEMEPPDGFWPQLSDREQEIFGPLLFHSRLAGIEKQALSAALAFSSQKLDVQSREADFALASELFEVLKEWASENFRPSELLEELLNCEQWGARLSDK